MSVTTFNITLNFYFLLLAWLAKTEEAGYDPRVVALLTDETMVFLSNIVFMARANPALIKYHAHRLANLANSIYPGVTTVKNTRRTLRRLVKRGQNFDPSTTTKTVLKSYMGPMSGIAALIYAYIPLGGFGYEPLFRTGPHPTLAVCSLIEATGVPQRTVSPLDWGPLLCMHLQCWKAQGRPALPLMPDAVLAATIAARMAAQGRTLQHLLAQPAAVDAFNDEDEDAQKASAIGAEGAEEDDEEFEQAVAAVVEQRPAGSTRKRTRQHKSARTGKARKVRRKERHHQREEVGELHHVVVMTEEAAAEAAPTMVVVAAEMQDGGPQQQQQQQAAVMAQDEQQRLLQQQQLEEWEEGWAALERAEPTLYGVVVRLMPLDY